MPPDTIQHAGLLGLYRGIVMDVNDPEGLMRIRVVIPTLTGSMVLSNWAWPCVPFLDINFLFNVGDPVWIAFEGGDLDHPVYVGTWLANGGSVTGWQTWTPVISSGTLTMTPAAHPANHARWRQLGRLVAVSYSQVFSLSGSAVNTISFSLPVPTAHARVVFRADAVNQLVRASTFDDVNTVTLQELSGNFPTTASYHFSFDGTYERA